jgi:hypothetical protein
MTDSTGCIATSSCTVTSPTPINVTICNYQNPSCQSCCDGFATGCASGGTPPYTYFWSPCNQTSVTAQALCVGTQTLCVVDANGCSSCTTVQLSSPTAVQEDENPFALSVYPDANGSFVLNASFASAETGEVVVTDVLGQVIFTRTFSGSTTLNETIDLSAAEPGMYFISVATNEGIVTKQIMRN